MKTYSEIKNPMLEDLRQLAMRTLPAGSRMVLYGSRARGDACPESDWDVHILVPGDERLSLKEITEIAMPFENLGWSYDEMVSVMVYSHLGWAKRSFLPYYKNVENDKIIIYAD